MITVRLNLKKGINYGKWKVIEHDGEVNHYDASSCYLVLKQCRLKNRPSTAKKIHSGGHKEVCAWIEAKDYEVIGTFYAHHMKVSGGLVHLQYNPKKNPYWTMEGENVDNEFFDKLITSPDKNVFWLKKSG